MTGLKSLPLKKEASGTQWLADLRQTAYDRAEKTGLPTRKWESWKYMDLEPVLNATLAGSAVTKLGDVILSDIQPYLAGQPEAARIVFVNGVYSKPLSSVEKLPRTIFLGPLEGAFRSQSEALRTHLGLNAAAEENSFVSINTFSFRDGIFLHVPEDAVVEGVIQFLFLNTDDTSKPLVTHPRVLITMDKGAKARIISSHVGTGKEISWTNEVLEAFLAPSAELEYVNLHRGTEKETQFFTGRFSLQEKSSLKAFTFVEGQAVVRSDIQVELNGEEAKAGLNGLSMLSESGQFFCHAAVQHKVSHCKSRQFFKNILSGSTQSEFNSLVSVDAGTVKTDSQQLNKNLLLSEGSVAHTRPQLRIDADDVICAHGATVGQLQKQELFYLRTRGLSEKEARYMLTYGFAKEMLEEIELPSLREALKTRISEVLGKMVGK